MGVWRRDVGGLRVTSRNEQKGGNGLLLAIYSHIAHQGSQEYTITVIEMIATLINNFVFLSIIIMVLKNIGQPPLGQPTRGQLLWGQLPWPQLPQRQLPQGQLPQGQLPRGQLPSRTTTSLAITNQNNYPLRISTPQDNNAYRTATPIGKTITPENNYPHRWVIGHTLNCTAFTDWE